MVVRDLAAVQFWKRECCDFYLFYQRPVLAFCHCHYLRLSAHVCVLGYVVCVCVCVCVCGHNSSPVQARITIYGPLVQNTLVKIPMALRCDWRCPSRWNLTSKSIMYPILRLFILITHSNLDHTTKLLHSIVLAWILVYVYFTCTS